MGRKKPLFVYVWPDYNPDYTSGLAVAIAHDEEEARRLVMEVRGLGWEPRWGTAEVHPVEPAAWEVSGGS